MTSPFSKNIRLLNNKAPVTESLVQKKAEVAVDSMEDSEEEVDDRDEIDAIKLDYRKEITQSRNQIVTPTSSRPG